MRPRFHIYIHTNTVNGKRYVGQTVHTVEGRWKEHVNAAKRNKGGARLLSAAIRKYGAAAFVHELLDVVTTQEGVDIAEARWIEQRRTRTPHGYNLSSGGGGNGHHHAESKRLIGDMSKRRIQAMTPEERVAYFRKNIHAWSPERLSRHLKWLKSEEAGASFSAGQKAFWSQFSSVEKSNRVKHQLSGMSPEQKSERVRKQWSSMTPEARTERVEKARKSRLDSLGPETRQRMRESQTTEQRREAAQKTWAIRRELYGSTGGKKVLTKSSEEYSAATKKGWAAMTPEARVERVRRTKEGALAAKAKLSPEALAERSRAKGLKIKEALRRSKEARESAARPVNLLRFNLLDRVVRRTRQSAVSSEVLDRAHAMRDAGSSLRVIAEQVGVSTTHLCRLLARGKKPA
jgi:group I intron endonuclease